MEITIEKVFDCERESLGDHQTPSALIGFRVPVIASLMDQFDVFKWKERANLRKKLSLEMRTEWYLSIP